MDGPRKKTADKGDFPTSRIERMRLPPALYKNIVDRLYEGIAVLSVDGTVNYWNGGAERITGFTAAEVLGKHCDDGVLVRVDAEGRRLCGTHRCPLVASLAGRTVPDGDEEDMFLVRKDGSRVQVWSRVIPIVEKDGGVAGMVEIFTDNLRLQKARKRISELERLALLDPLTGIGNRRYVELFIAARLEDLTRYGWPFGVLMMDLDGFKAVNDTLGHSAGDDVLRRSAKVLRSELRKSDVLGRWGGDEFLAVVVGVSEADLVPIAEKAGRSVKAAGAAAGVNISLSVGATSGRPGDSLRSLVERADALMYRSKRGGGDRVSLG